MARFIQLKDFETEGERRTSGLLTDGLPDHWVVIYGVMLVGFAGMTHEVDFFAIGDHGVYLIDDKYFKGRVIADRGSWEVEFGSVENPVEKVEMVAKKAAGLLREGVPDISAALGSSYFLHAYVCLSGQVDLEKRDSDSTARVLLADRLPAALLGFDRSPAKAALPVADVREAIVDYLTAGRAGMRPSAEVPQKADSPPEGTRDLPGEVVTPTAAPHRSHRLSVLKWLPVACLAALAVMFALTYRSDQPLRWDRAASRAGNTATVYGPVVQSVKKPRWGELSYINIGRDFQPGSPTPFYLRIDPEYRSAVEAELKQLTHSSASPWDAYGTKTVWIKSRILADRYGGSYMLVTTANDIHIGQPRTQTRYLAAALVAAVAAVVWAVALILVRARRRVRATGETVAA